MAWPFSGNWDGKSLEDLPEIISALCNAINERRSYLGASLIPFATATGTSTAPTASDFDGMINSSRDAVLKKIGEECWIGTSWVDPNDLYEPLSKSDALSYVGLLSNITGGPQYATHLDWYLTAKGLLDLQYIADVDFKIDSTATNVTICQYCNSGCTTNNPNTVSVSTENFRSNLLLGDGTTNSGTILKSEFSLSTVGRVAPLGTVTLDFGPENFSTYNPNVFDISLGYPSTFAGPTTATTTGYYSEFTFDSAPTAAYSDAYQAFVRLYGVIDFASELTYIE